MNTTVLMFGWEFPPHNSGGLGVACLGLTRALVEEGVNVIFVLPKKVPVDTQYAKMLFANIGSVSIIGINTLLTPYISSTQYESHLRSETDADLYGQSLIQEVYRYAYKARKIAEQENFDVIHAHDWLSFPAGLAAKKASGKPLILHVHATEFDRTGGQGENKQIYEIEKNALHKADYILTVSERTKNQIIKQYGIDPQKIEVVYNGVDQRDWNHGPALRNLSQLRIGDKKVVLFAGRITIQKGLEYFLRSARKVLDHDPNVLFIVSGSGDMEHQMIQETASLGISDKVLFVGFLRGAELQEAFRASDLYVMPSVSEPFGLLPLEALLHGTPVLISKQSGVSEILTNALKVDFWDIDEMANKIINVLWNHALQETLSSTGKDEVASISWKSAAQKCINVYGKIKKMW